MFTEEPSKVKGREGRRVVRKRRNGKEGPSKVK